MFQIAQLRYRKKGSEKAMMYTNSNALLGGSMKLVFIFILSYGAFADAPSALTVKALPNQLVRLQWKNEGLPKTGWEIFRAPDINGKSGMYERVGTLKSNRMEWEEKAPAPNSYFWYTVAALSSAEDKINTSPQIKVKTQ